ncbi:MAG: lysine--tRNA ligase [Phycisphaeraceae bacterium]|nr:lysine--tRNA ligase [Phycisphaeraceae bacterium]
MNTPNDPRTPRTPGDIEGDRRRKMARLRDELGIEPYGGRIDGLLPLAEARAKYDAAADEAHKQDATQDARPRVRVAGRVVQSRVMGNLIFLSLRDCSGDLQVAVSKKSVPPEVFKLAKQVDLSDIVTAAGPLGSTKTGEITVWSQGAPGGDAGLTLACKSLAPPPEKFHGLTDPEQRYRKRYVDLYANPDVMRTMQLRIRIIDEIRDYLRGRGFLEVETPMLQSLHGGAAARPFITHHNALDMPLYLRIAPELYLKRLLVGGFNKVFEINRNFRNEGLSPRHNPEFTMLEAYEAFGSWETVADLVEDLVCTVAMKVFGTLEINHRDAEDAEKITRTINLKRPWRRVSMVDLVREELGWSFNKKRASAQDVQTILSAIQTRSFRKIGLRLKESNPSLAGKLLQAGSVEAYRREKDKVLAFIRAELTHLEQEFNRLQNDGRLEDKAELERLDRQINTLTTLMNDFHRLIDESGAKREADVFLYKFTHMSPAEQLVEVYEKLIEPTLIDPTFVTHVPSAVIPLARENRDDPFFADVYELAINGVEISPGYSELNDPDVQERHLRHQVGDREEQQEIDGDFLEALKVGMPPAGGFGLGIDRLVMMLTGATSIRDVILFPLMRPQG